MVPMRATHSFVGTEVGFEIFGFAQNTTKGATVAPSHTRLSLSVHDEIRCLVKEEDKYRAAMALQISNIWTRAIFSENLGMKDLPQSCACFSALDVDHIFRKEVDMDCITPSNQVAVKPGESLDIVELLARPDSSLGEGKNFD